MKFFNNIKNKLVVAFSLFIAILLVVIAIGTYAYFRQSTRELIYNQQFSMITSKAHDLDHQILSVHKALISVANVAPVDDLNNREIAQKWLNNRTGIYSHFSNGLSILDATGTLIVSVPADPAKYGTSFASLEYFKKSKSTGEPVISSPYLSSGTKQPAIMMTAPIRGKDGTLRGFLCGSIDLLEKDKGIFGALKEAKIGVNGYLYLITQERAMVMHPDQSRIMAYDFKPGDNKLLDKAIEGFEGSDETINSRGKHFLTSFKRLKSTNWILAANYPVAEAYLPITAFRNYYTFGMVIVLLLSVTFAWMLGAGIYATEEKLKSGLNYFKSLLVNNTTGILVVSSERIISEVNPQLCAMFGYEEQELLGQSTEIIHVDREYFEGFAGILNEALIANKQVVQIEYQLCRKDGSCFWAAISGVKSQLLDNAHGVVWSLIDITDRKLADEAVRISEEKFRTVANHTYDWEYWLSPDGTLAYVSPSCERISGYTAESFTQHPELITEIIHSDDVDSFARHLAPSNNLISENCLTPDFRIRTKNGEERWIAHVCQEVFDDKGVSLGRRACNRDVTESKLAKTMLVDNQAELKAVYDNAPVMMCLVDASRRIIYANSEFTDFLGLSEDELKGGHACGVFGCCNVNDDPRGCGYGANCKSCTLLRAIEDSFQTGAAHRNDEHSITLVRNGIDHKLTLLGSTALVESNNSKHLLLCLHDISERKQVEEKLLSTNSKLEDASYEMSLINTQLEQRRQELLIARDEVVTANERTALATRAGSVGIWEYDVVNKIRVWDDQMYRLYGVDSDSSVDIYQTWLAGLHPDDTQRVNNEFRMALRGESNIDTSFRVVWPDGSVHYIRALAIVDRDPLGQPLRMIGTNWDISTYKEAEDALFDFSEALKEKNAQLEIALKDAEQATLAKSQFLANMSHEIRTPLTAVIGFTDLALQSSQQSYQEECIRKISIAGVTLLHLVNDLLDFSKIEAGELMMEMEPFRLNDLISNLEAVFYNSAIDKGLEFVSHCPLDYCLFGDSHRLSQVIANLLSNAIKFTKNGSVRLRVSSPEREDNKIKLLFSIHDTGIGISAHDLGRIFESFTQADGSTSRKYGGTGLGLSISKRLVEMMGGEIFCESSIGTGSTFSFTAWLQIGEPACCQRDNSHDTYGRDNEVLANNFSWARILVADDNEINQELVVELLKEAGAYVDVANNGKEALTMILENNIPYDLVLMDIQMPVMDGYEATRLIRSDQRFTDLPIVALTGNALVSEQNNTMESGFTGFLPKPYTIQILYDTIGHYINRSESAFLDMAAVKGEADTIDIPTIHGLDTATAIDSMDGNTKLYLSILRSFVEHDFNSAHIIETALSQGDFELAQRTAHSIRGSAGAIGATQLEIAARSLENAISRKDPQNSISDSLIIFSAELDQLVKELDASLPAVIIAQTGSADVDREAITPVLNGLQKLLIENDTSVEHYLDNFENILSALPSRDMEPLRNCIVSFEFDEAKKALITLAKHNGLELITFDREVSNENE